MAAGLEQPCRWAAAHLSIGAPAPDEALPSRLPIPGDSRWPAGGFKQRAAAVGREAALEKQLLEAVRDRQVRVRRQPAEAHMHSPWGPLHTQPHNLLDAHTLHRRQQDLHKRYEARDATCSELRSKLKAAKAALAAREHELQAAQRLAQHLAAEKQQLRVRAHTRRRACGKERRLAGVGAERRRCCCVRCRRRLLLPRCTRAACSAGCRSCRRWRTRSPSTRPPSTR